MAGGIGTGGQAPVHSRFGQGVGIAHQGIHRINTGVEVVFDGVEVTVVRVGDLGWNVALGDAIDVVGRHVQGANHRVQRGIHARDDVFVFTMVFRGIGTGGQLTLHRSLRQPRSFAAHGFDGMHRFVQCSQNLTHFIACRGVDLHREITGGNFFCNLHSLTHGAGNAARDQPTQQHSQQHSCARQAQQQGLRRRNDRSRASARLFHQLGLVAHQLGNGVEVGGLLLAQVAR